MKRATKNAILLIIGILFLLPALGVIFMPREVSVSLQETTLEMPLFTKLSIFLCFIAGSATCLFVGGMTIFFAVDELNIQAKKYLAERKEKRNTISFVSHVSRPGEYRTTLTWSAEKGKYILNVVNLDEELRS